MCSNLIFSFDLVKRLYLEYMSLFKFMRSDGVLSVIGIIYTRLLRMPLRLDGDNNMIGVSVGVKTDTVPHTMQITPNVLLCSSIGSIYLVVNLKMLFTAYGIFACKSCFSVL